MVGNRYWMPLPRQFQPMFQEPEEPSAPPPPKRLQGGWGTA